MDDIPGTIVKLTAQKRTGGLFTILNEINKQVRSQETRKHTFKILIERSVDLDSFYIKADQAFSK